MMSILLTHQMSEFNDQNNSGIKPEKWRFLWMLIYGSQHFLDLSEL